MCVACWACSTAVMRQHAPPSAASPAAACVPFVEPCMLLTQGAPTGLVRSSLYGQGAALRYAMLCHTGHIARVVLGSRQGACATPCASTPNRHVRQAMPRQAAAAKHMHLTDRQGCHVPLGAGGPTQPARRAPGRRQRTHSNCAMRRVCACCHTAVWLGMVDE